MERWEYMVLEQPPGMRCFVDVDSREQYPGSLHTVLNALGGEGWQLMSTERLQDERFLVVVGRHMTASY